MNTSRISLPADAVIDDVNRAIAQAGGAVVVAPPGTGKTTRIPWGIAQANPGQVWTLEPRRLAARLASARVASELGEPLGEQVGYEIRHERKLSPRTRLRFMTEGILTRRLTDPSSLQGVSAIVLDEFHERHIHADVAIALLRKRKAPPWVIMSATLDGKTLARDLGVPLIEVTTPMHPVEMVHLPTRPTMDLPRLVAQALRQVIPALAPAPAHVLVFLPGMAEIRAAMAACDRIMREHQLIGFPLHGALPAAQQDRALSSNAPRKVFFTTNVAESSITIEGVVAVIDSGLARVARHSPWSGLPTLALAPISRASATQRAGRAGRTRPGVCHRLFTLGDFQSRPEQDLPELLRSDLSETVLTIRASGENEDALPWVSPPQKPQLDAASTLLVRLGSLDATGAVTPIGSRMARMPLHPRLGRLLLAGEELGALPSCLRIAAILSDRDILKHRGRLPDGYSDLLGRSDLLERCERERLSEGEIASLDLDPGAVRTAIAATIQLRRGMGSGDTADIPEMAERAALLAFPDRVGQIRTQEGKRTITFADGGRAEVASTSAAEDGWAVGLATEERGEPGRTTTVATLLVNIHPDWLIEHCADSLVDEERVELSATGKAFVVRTLRIGSLVLDETRTVAPPEVAARAQRDQIMAKGIDALFTEPAAEILLRRWRLARSWSTALEEPTRARLEEGFSECLDGGLPPDAVTGVVILEHLLQGSGLSLLRRLCPTEVQLMAGRMVSIEYPDQGSPFIASRLQDFFGMAASPTIGEGRHPLVLHLLAPNKRAVQITRDLPSFWREHYPSIAKELRRKYPRHNFPEDPTKPQPALARDARKR